ncbi:MAG: beta-ketoacyl-[acyl-carrier-protein] synthase family protein [Bacteroidetes bacterium]|nr:beta-ketoacyl-[acyl-carrier-protein] synthase family protein [Bacteroidota bacterium]
MSEEIVITGMGIICSIGKEPEEVTGNLRKGIHGITKKEFDFGGKPSPVSVGAVPFSNIELANELGLDIESGSRTYLLGLHAARQAINCDKTLDAAHLKGGFIAGGTVGGMDLTEKCFQQLQEADVECVRVLEEHDLGSATFKIAEDLGIENFATTISTACSSAANAIIMGCRMLKSRQLDYAVVGGMDSLTSFTISGFSSLMIYDDKHCRPFDINRNGLNLGEGAGFLLIRRKSDVLHGNELAVVSGYANANDAFHQTASSEFGTGAFMAMKEAVESSCIAPENISYVNAHGTGTANNDASEMAALDRIFGMQDCKIPYVSTKSYTGHTLAAAGAIEAVISIECLRKGFIPPNLNLQHPIESKVMKAQQTLGVLRVDHILSNSFGFGGNCTSLIFSKSGGNEYVPLY